MSMNRRYRGSHNELSFDIHLTAQLLGDVSHRTIRRWTKGGLPRQFDGRFPLPAVAMWWLLHVRHRYDDRCKLEEEEDLLIILQQGDEADS
jgi:hypothetical protein